MKRKGFHYSWWALLNYLQLESYKILFKFKVMFSIFFVQVWLLGTHKHYCQTVYCWCCHVNICSKFFFLLDFLYSCIQSLVKPTQTDLKNSLFRKKKDVTLKQSRNDLKNNKTPVCGSKCTYRLLGRQTARRVLALSALLGSTDERWFYWGSCELRLGLGALLMCWERLPRRRLLS